MIDLQNLHSTGMALPHRGTAKTDGRPHGGRNAVTAVACGTTYLAPLREAKIKPQFISRKVIQAKNFHDYR